MNRSLSILALLLLTIASQAQNLQLLSDSLGFGPTTEIQSDTLFLRIHNPHVAAIDVTDIDFFEIYGDKPFNLSDTSFTVNPGDTQVIAVGFLPEHNILHDMAMVVKTSSGFGHLIVKLTGQGRYSNSYYSSSENLVGSALKTALKTRIGQGYNSLGYNSARDNMFMTIDNQRTNGQGAAVNTLECIYTGTVITGYASRSAAQNGSPQFNTEHTFPQSKFSSNEPMRSDIHHLFPTTNTSNSQRGSDPFGTVTNATWTQGGSRKGNGKFEPRNVQKGPTARAMMYFVLRYQDYTSFFASQESILRSWHLQYLPDSIDRRRNDDIFAVQGNRNPFVDYPQFVERIPSLVNNSAPAAVRDLYVSDDTIKLAQGIGRYSYNYVLYNNGNTELNFSGFSLSDTSLNFVGGTPANFKLAPQASRAIEISFDAARAYSASMNYTVDLSGSTVITTPIGVGRNIGLAERVVVKLGIYPNPTNGFVNLSLSDSDIERVWISTSTGIGRELKLSGENQVDLSKEPSGFYILSVQTSSGDLSQAPLVIQ